MRAWQIILGLAVSTATTFADPAPGEPHLVARAEAATARGDLRDAIADYEAAYAADANSELLLRLAELHERLGERRTAADILNRSLEAIQDADRREAILRRVNALHEVPSAVMFDVEPAGAEIAVDGAPIGASPQQRNFAAGSHDVRLSASGRRLRVLRIVLEYGEPVTLQLRLESNAPASAVPVLSVSTPARASAGEEPAPAARSWHVTLGGRWSLVPEDREGGWAGLSAGIRGLSDHVEVQALAGMFGATIGRGVGAAARGYILTGRVQPFVSGAALFGAARGYELGVGATTPLGEASGGAIRFEAVLQVELLTIHDAPAMPVGSARVVIPVTFGLAARI